MPLKTAVQRRAGQGRDSGLQRVKAVIERQQRVAPEGDDNGLVLRREHGRARVPGPGALVGNRRPGSPLSNRLRIDPVAPGENPQALLTMLYRSTHRLCRAGAPVENLAHSASFHSWDKNAPSNPGTEHLVARSRMSLISCNNRCELSRMPRLYSLCRGVNGPKYWSFKISEKPIIALSGVRSS